VADWAECIELPVTDADRDWARQCATIAIAMQRAGQIEAWRQTRFYSDYEIAYTGRLGEAAMRRRAGLELFAPEVIRGRRNDAGHDLDDLAVEVKTTPWRSVVHFHLSAEGRRHTLNVPTSRPWGIRTTVLCSYFFSSGRVYLDGFATVDMIRELGIPIRNGRSRPAVAVDYVDLLPAATFLGRLDRIVAARPAPPPPPPPDRLLASAEELGPPSSAAEAAFRADYPHLTEWRAYPRW
jgi:hypothetical protein